MVRSKEWQEAYMMDLTKFVVELIEKADSVPQYLQKTIPDKYKPKRLLAQLSKLELDAAR